MGQNFKMRDSYLSISNTVGLALVFHRLHLTLYTRNPLFPCTSSRHFPTNDAYCQEDAPCAPTGGPDCAGGVLVPVLCSRSGTSMWLPFFVIPA